MELGLKQFFAVHAFLSAATIQAALSLVVAFGWHPTPGTIGVIEAAAAAVLAFLAGVSTGTVNIPLATGALTAIGALLIAFGVPHITEQTVAAVVALLAAVMGTAGHVAVRVEALLEVARAQGGVLAGKAPEVQRQS